MARIKIIDYDLQSSRKAAGKSIIIKVRIEQLKLNFYISEVDDDLVKTNDDRTSSTSEI